MTPEAFREALATLSLSQIGCARLLGLDGRTIRRWIVGDQGVPYSVEIALRLMIKHGEKPSDWEARKPA